MNKTLTIIRPGESHDDYSWALKLTDSERISLADKLLRDLWTAAHGQPYPLMDRTVVRLLKQRSFSKSSRPSIEPLSQR